MNKAFVAVLMGSKSDLPVIVKTPDMLKRLEIPFEVKITSAHRTPAATHACVRGADLVKRPGAGRESKAAAFQAADQELRANL